MDAYTLHHHSSLTPYMSVNHSPQQHPQHHHHAQMSPYPSSGYAAQASTSHSTRLRHAHGHPGMTASPVSAGNFNLSDWLHSNPATAYQHGVSLPPSPLPPTRSSDMMEAPSVNGYDNGNGARHAPTTRQTRQSAQATAHQPATHSASSATRLMPPDHHLETSTEPQLISGPTTRTRQQQRASSARNDASYTHSQAMLPPVQHAKLPPTLDSTRQNSASENNNVGYRTRRAVNSGTEQSRQVNSSESRAQSRYVPKTPQQAEESSVPEAALHLLRLALPSGSTGSVATTTTLDDDRSCDEDADGESDATSVHSDDGFDSAKKVAPGATRSSDKSRRARAPYRSTRSSTGSAHVLGTQGHALAAPSLPHVGELGTRFWQHADGQPPLQFPVSLPRRGPGSTASSIASVRTRSHVPARAQREQSAAASSRAGSEHSRSPVFGSSGSILLAGRRTSGRLRKTVVPSEALYCSSDASHSDVDHIDEDMSLHEQYHEAFPGDLSGRDFALTSREGEGRAIEDESEAHATLPALPSRNRRGGSKRLSTGSPAPMPPKRPRASTSASASTMATVSTNDDTMSVTSSTTTSSRKRRAPVAPLNFVNRTFPPSVPINPGFPRFYRAFPISAAFPPDSFVHRSTATALSHAQPCTQLDSSGVVLPSPTISPLHGAFNFDQPTNYLDPYNLAVGLPQIPVQAVGPASASGRHESLGSPVALTGGGGGFDVDLGAHDMSQLLPTSHQPPHGGFDDGTRWLVRQPPDGAKWNKVPDPFNLYTTRFVKGNAGDKCGLCPICIEPVERGGSGEEKWLKVRSRAASRETQLRTD